MLVLSSSQFDPYRKSRVLDERSLSCCKISGSQNIYCTKPLRGRGQSAGQCQRESAREVRSLTTLAPARVCRRPAL
jgi:hypothetical protein